MYVFHLNICVTVYGFMSQLSIFTHMKTTTLLVKGLQILTYNRHSWPFSSEHFFLMCHTYCDVDHLLKWSSPVTRNTHTCCRAFGMELSVSCLAF